MPMGTLLAAAVFLLTPPEAGVELEMDVDGLACQFCAYSLEKGGGNP